MVKEYVILSNFQREELCRLVYECGLTIKEAARRTNVPYPNAKAVNKTFERELRTAKKHRKFAEGRDGNISRATGLEISNFEQV